MTELAPYLDADVHVDAGDLCVDGRLVVADQTLRVVGALGRTLLELPLADLEWTHAETLGAAWPQISLEFGRPWLVHVWLRAHARCELPCLDF